MIYFSSVQAEKLPALFQRKGEKRVVYFIIGLLCAAALFFTGIMLYDSNRFVTVEYRIRCRGLKRKYRFVMLSDLHNKSYGEHNEKLLAAIEKQKPESILIAGDMLTSEKPERTGPAQELVEKLAARYPVYYANGNHEYRLKMEEARYGSGYRRYHARLERKGVVFLENDSVLLPEAGIRIYGAEIGKEYYQKEEGDGHGRGIPEKTAGKTVEGGLSYPAGPQPGLFSRLCRMGSRPGALRPCARRHHASAASGRRHFTHAAAVSQI